MFIPRRFLLILPSFLLMSLGSLAGGCSSSAESGYSSSVLVLREIHETPTGQLALIYDQSRTYSPGQRAFFVDQLALDRNVSAALEEIKSNLGRGEALSGSVILHRTHSLNSKGEETFWAELDPYNLPGNWMPPLTEPALTPEALVQSLPASFTPSAVPPGQPPQQADIQPFATPDTQAFIVKPGDHFLWLTNSGPLDTSVANLTLFPPHHDSVGSKFGRVVEGTAEFAVATAVVVGVVTLDIFGLEYHSHGDYPEFRHRH